MLLKTKLKVWNKYCHPSDKRIAPCNNCCATLKYPNLLQHSLNIYNNTFPSYYEVVGEATFYNINSHTIILLCNDCNKKNIKNINHCPEYIMLDKN